VVGAVHDQRRRQLIVRPTCFNDIVIVRSKHLADIPREKFTDGIRRLLGLRK